MSLKRDEIKGIIKEINISNKGYNIPGVGFIVIAGMLAISSVVGFFIKKSNYEYNPDKYDTYSSQLEDKYDKDFNYDDEYILNDLGDKQLLVEKYKETKDAEEKKSFEDMIVESSYELGSIALEVAKKNVALKNGGDYTDYRFKDYGSKVDGAIWKAVKRGEQDPISIDSKTANLVNLVANIQYDRDMLALAKAEKDLDPEKAVDELVNKYSEVVRKTAEYINTKEKAK